MSAAPPLRFHPRSRRFEVALGGGPPCIVLDGALAEPHAWIEWATSRRGDFAERGDNAYPGPELALPETALDALADCFDQHARHALGGRRTLRRHGRLALATRSPAQLAPRQWLCHVDRLGIVPGECIGASVLYLFADPALGGTAFFRPRRPLPEIAALVQDSARLDPAAFAVRSGLAPGYMTRSNAWFERVAAVPAAFNRLVFYPGNVFHGADIEAPARLSPDPARGRLTLNGFFACRSRAAV